MPRVVYHNAVKQQYNGSIIVNVHNVVGGVICILGRNDSFAVYKRQ